MVDSPRLDRSDFGPNEWLIDEMYRQFQESPESVGEAWREFFEDYRPRERERERKREPERPSAERPSPMAEPRAEAEDEQPGDQDGDDGELLPIRRAADLDHER